VNTKKLTKLLALYLPYILLGLVATNFGEAWRLAEGKELGERIMSMMGTLPAAFANPLPSLHPLDLLIGISCGAGLRLAVYLRSKNAKKYRHGMEYGSARWGTAKDIEPFQAPKFEDNIILTKTERLMMSNRPSDPKNARNKNVLIVGGSGSGKTRFWLKPNLLQMHSSYVVTDPKGYNMDKELKELQKQFMPEDTKAGLIQSFLDNFKGTQVCSKLIYAEALNHPFDEPKQWEIREINEIMNNSIEGWRPFSNPRSFAKYGRQRGWERIPPPDNEPSATGSNLTDGFRELTEEEARQMELPF
jgi:hypothetical protein